MRLGFELSENKFVNDDFLNEITQGNQLNDLPKDLKDRLVLTNPYTGLNDISGLTAILKRRLKQRFQQLETVK